MKTLACVLLLIGTTSAAEPSMTLGTTALLGREKVHAVLFSPDSTRIGLVDCRGLRYWNLIDGKPGASYPGEYSTETVRLHSGSDGDTTYSTIHEKEKHYAAFVAHPIGITTRHELKAQPDSVFFSETGAFAAVERDGDCRILQMSDGETLTAFAKPDGVRRFSASRDGRTLAICNRNGEVKVLRAGGLIWSPPIAAGHLFTSVAVSPDGTLLATASLKDDGETPKAAGPVQIWSMRNNSLVRTCDAVEWYDEAPNRLTFTPDGLLLLAGDGAYLRGWTVATGQPMFAAEPGRNYPGSLVISPDSRYVAVAYLKRALVWDLRTGRMPKGFEGHSGPVGQMALSADGKLLATTSNGLPQILIWNTTTGAKVGEMTAHFAGRGAAAKPDRLRIVFSPDGRQLASVNEAASPTGPLRVWDVASGRMLWEMPVAEAIAPPVAFTRAGLQVGPILHAVETGRTIWTCSGVKPTALLVSRRGDRLVLAEKSRNLVVDTASGRTLATCEGVPQAFTPDGLGLVLVRLGPEMTQGVFNNIVGVRSLAESNETEIGRIPMETVLKHLSGDGDVYVTPVIGRTARDSAYTLREVAGDRLLATINRLDTAATTRWSNEHHKWESCFSPDHRLFAAMYKEGRLGVWCTFTGRTLLDEDTGCPMARVLAFAPDGRRLYTASGEIGGGPVLGYDTAALGQHAAISGPPAEARQAIFELAKDPANALATAKTILSVPSEADGKQFDAWIAMLSVGAFAEREAASKGLSEAGWRVEPRLKAALAVEGSAEGRMRLEAILEVPDQRPLRAIHLLEVIDTPEARAVLKDVITRSPDSLIRREAQRSLARMSIP